MNTLSWWNLSVDTQAFLMRLWILPFQRFFCPLIGFHIFICLAWCTELMFSYGFVLSVVLWCHFEELYALYFSLTSWTSFMGFQPLEALNLEIFGFQKLQVEYITVTLSTSWWWTNLITWHFWRRVLDFWLSWQADKIGTSISIISVQVVIS